MRLFQLLLASLLLILTALPAHALDPCATSTATLTGGYTVDGYVYDQEMRLEHKGAGMTGLWVGTYYAQHNTYSFALDDMTRAAAMMAGASTVAAVDAVCVPELPDANTVTVACTGRIPFTFRANGTITWEGLSQVIGEYSGTHITIDMVRGAPGYAAQNVVSHEMSGFVLRAGDMSLLFDVTAHGKIAGTTMDAYSYTVKGRAEPAGATVVIFGTPPGKAGGPVVTSGASADTIDVILRHAVADQRAKQAETVKIRLEADWGKGCHTSRDTTLWDVMVLVGTPP